MRRIHFYAVTKGLIPVGEWICGPWAAANIHYGNIDDGVMTDVAERQVQDPKSRCRVD